MYTYYLNYVTGELRRDKIAVMRSWFETRFVDDHQNSPLWIQFDSPHTFDCTGWKAVTYPLKDSRYYLITGNRGYQQLKVYLTEEQLMLRDVELVKQTLNNAK